MQAPHSDLASCIFVLCLGIATFVESLQTIFLTLEGPALSLVSDEVVSKEIPFICRIEKDQRIGMEVMHF